MRRLVPVGNSFTLEHLGFGFRTLREIFHKRQPNIVFLRETKIEFLKHRLANIYFFSLGTVGLNGGLALFWNKDIDLKLLSSSSNQIDTFINDGEENWQTRGYCGLSGGTHGQRLGWFGIYGELFTWTNRRTVGDLIQDTVYKFFCSSWWIDIVKAQMSQIMRQGALTIPHFW